MWRGTQLGKRERERRCSRRKRVDGDGRRRRVR